ncbi:MAG: TRAP transporter small permease [Pirellulaceae bacterium]|nr:TRAP transporter small permease [Planctomycetales bacterium]
MNTTESARDHLPLVISGSWLLKWTVIVCMAALTLDVLWGVLCRYVLKHADAIMPGLRAVSASSLAMSMELSTILLIWVTFLGAALAFQDRAHLGVDYFTSKLHPQGRRWAELLVYVIVIAFTVTVMILGGTVLTWRTFSDLQTLPALGIYKGYIYLAVPVGGSFFLMFALDGLGQWFRTPTDVQA